MFYHYYCNFRQKLHTDLFYRLEVDYMSRASPVSRAD